MDKTIIATLSCALFFMGLLVGTLLALSAESVAQALIAALFALFGGSLLAFLRHVSLIDQLKTSAGVLAISVGTLGGVYSGIYVNQHQLLTPTALQASRPSDVVNTYLRGYVMPTSAAIDTQYRNKELTAEQAYQRLHELVDKQSK
jgi:hypothetical protein